MLGEATLSLIVYSSIAELYIATRSNIKELFAHLQFGHLEAKNKALVKVHDVMKEDEKNVLTAFCRSNIAALVQLLTAT